MTYANHVFIIITMTFLPRRKDLTINISGLLWKPCVYRGKAKHDKTSKRKETFRGFPPGWSRAECVLEMYPKRSGRTSAWIHHAFVVSPCMSREIVSKGPLVLPDKSHRQSSSLGAGHVLLNSCSHTARKDANGFLMTVLLKPPELEMWKSWQCPIIPSSPHHLDFLWGKMCLGLTKR